MLNKLKSLRESAGMSQKELAEKVGVTQLQIQRIETNKRPASLPLAKLICAAIGRPLNAVFPGSAKALAAFDREQGQGHHPSTERYENLREVGIERDCRQHTLKILLRGHEKPMFFSLPAYEVDGIFSRVQEEESDTVEVTFMVFDTDDLRVAINLREVIFCHFLWDAGFMSGLPDDQAEIAQDDANPREKVQVFFSGNCTPTWFGPEAEDRTDNDDENRYFNTIFIRMDFGVQKHERLHFVDEDGESAFLRAGDIALLTVPLWIVDPDERIDADGPDEDDGAPPTTPSEGGMSPGAEHAGGKAPLMRKIVQLVPRSRA